jgi:hypothetical protein
MFRFFVVVTISQFPTTKDVENIVVYWPEERIGEDKETFKQKPFSSSQSIFHTSQNLNVKN